MSSTSTALRINSTSQKCAELDSKRPRLAPRIYRHTASQVHGKTYTVGVGRSQVRGRWNTAQEPVFSEQKHQDCDEKWKGKFIAFYLPLGEQSKR